MVSRNSSILCNKNKVSLCCNCWNPALNFDSMKKRSTRLFVYRVKYLVRVIKRTNFLRQRSTRGRQFKGFLHLFHLLNKKFSAYQKCLHIKSFNEQNRNFFLNEMSTVFSMYIWSFRFRFMINREANCSVLIAVNWIVLELAKFILLVSAISCTHSWRRRENVVELLERNCAVCCQATQKFTRV